MCESTRRDFLRAAGATGVAATGFVATDIAALSAQTGAPVRADASTPWYRRVCRWGQTNITERDPVRYGIP